MIIYECDMCGKHSPCAMPVLKVPAPSVEITPFDPSEMEIMLCHDCVDILHEFIKNVRKSKDAEKEAKNGKQD